MMTNRPRVMAKARPGAMPLPVRQDVHALTKPEVFDRWSESAAGVRALSSDDNVITMFDVIGEQVNSAGGDMFEGIAIFNVLREHSQPVTVKVMGMAASAASIIAMAGDTVEIGAASFLMIHNCWVVAVGNRHDMRETSEWLEPFDRAMADLYAARTGKPLAEIQKWMDAETFMSGSQAIERGFADALLPADTMKVDDKAKASDRGVNDLRAMELRLVSAGMTRSDARARINSIKGTPGAALEPATPGAGDPWSGLSALISTIRSCS